MMLGMQADGRLFVQHAHARRSATAVIGCATKPGCYGPAILRAAYGVTRTANTRGENQTVAIVDAYGYPGVRSDLATYRAAFGLPACRATCLRIVNQRGATSPLPPPSRNPGDDWRGEQALDLDMISALCPNCRILLVQTKSDLKTDLSAGAATAARLGADVVSNSYAGIEVLAGDPHYARSGVVYTAAAGDNGAGAEQPCSFTHVVCVGGTSLRRAHNARGWSEVTWIGTGSGCSAIVAKPAWQHDKGCTMRSESDVSADADPLTGVAIVCTPCGSGAGSVITYAGGTSMSTPLVAALIALAGNARNVPQPQGIWQAGASGSAGLNDVTSGTNESKAGHTFICPKRYRYICFAGKGYDGPTGWGTPNGLSAL